MPADGEDAALPGSAGLWVAVASGRPARRLLRDPLGGEWSPGRGSLAEAGRFDEADRQFAGRFFPREEGGVNVRQVFLEVKLRRAIVLVKAGACARALDIVNRLTQPVEGLEFTRDGLEPFLRAPRLAPMLNEVRAACPAR